MFKSARTLILLVLVVMALVPLPVYDVVAQQVTLTYTTLSLRTLYDSEAPDTTYELYIPLPKSVWSGCRDFELYTQSLARVPVWLIECIDGDAGVQINAPQLTITTSTPPVGWNTDPYFDDSGWVRGYGNQGYWNDYNIDVAYGSTTIYYYRYVVNLPIKPSSATLHVRVGKYDSAIVGTINGCYGSGSCLITVNGQAYGSPAIVYGFGASATFDVTSVIREGPNVISTIATTTANSPAPYFGIRLTVVFNNHWIARVYARIPIQLSTTPTTIYVFYRSGANVKDPNTFMFIDDFNTYDSSKYTVSGLTVSHSASDGTITLSTTSSGSITLSSISPKPPVAFVALIRSNIVQSSSATYVRFQSGGTTVTEIVVSAGSSVPNRISPNTIRGGAWPWIVGYIALSTTTAYKVVGQRYSAVYTSLSPLSTYTNEPVTISSYTPAVAVVAATSGYTVGVTIDWWAVFKPPSNFRNPVYTASNQVYTLTLSFEKILLPSPSAPSSVVAFRFSTTAYGGDSFNSGLMTGQGFIKTGSDGLALSFPSRSSFALQFAYSGPFNVMLGYTSQGSFTEIERLSYDGSTLRLINSSNTVLVSVNGVTAPGHVQLEVFGSERKIYVYTSTGVIHATGTSKLSSFNTVMYGDAVSSVTIMESLLVTFIHNGLLAIRVTGVDAANRRFEIYTSDAGNIMTVGSLDIDITPGVVTIGIPLGVYPVKINVTSYLDVHTIQYSLIVPDIETLTLTINIGSQQTGGPIVALLANSLNKIGAMVGGEHRPLIATAVVLTLTFLATLTTAPLIAVIAAVALIAMAIAGWVNLPVALIAVFIVVAVITARRYTR